MFEISLLINWYKIILENYRFSDREREKGRRHESNPKLLGNAILERSLSYVATIKKQSKRIFQTFLQRASIYLLINLSTNLTQPFLSLERILMNPLNFPNSVAPSSVIKRDRWEKISTNLSRAKKIKRNKN